MLALYKVVKYLCLEMSICVIYRFMKLMPQGLSDDRNFRTLQTAHNMETVYQIIKLQGR